MTVRSSIQVPSDHTKSDFTTMESEIELLFRIEACLIDFYDVGSVVPTITYTIGDPDLVSDPYSFL